MLWNFQGIECMKQDDGRIAGVKKQNSRERFEKNEHSCSMKGVLIVSDSTARPGRPDSENQAHHPSSNNSNIDKQKISETPLGLIGMAYLPLNRPQHIICRRTADILLIMIFWLGSWEIACL